MATQTKTGKAFEYALLKEFYERLSTPQNNVIIIENAPYLTAKSSYDDFPQDSQGLYSLVASAAINFLVDIEPRLSESISAEDVLQLEIVSDSEGQLGDVRDVLAIRLLQKWEIGISAKNNHRAVKHSRLSPNIDFGKKWIGISCSNDYFKEIEHIFNYLTDLKIRDKDTQWASIPDMHKKIYIPLLNAFKKELERLNKHSPNVVPQKLVEYLIGNKDFYKVIKGKNSLEIQAYNLHGTLNQSIGKSKPKAKIPKLKLPTRLIEIVYEKNSETTLIVSMNEGWQISFRIHNASSKVETSLKFDINLISSPHTLFNNHIFIGER